jgi:tRNA(Arg) A34 adenosine deaminase TadA
MIRAMPSHEDWMRLAIDTCRRGIEAGQSPFGAVIVRGDDELVVAAHNVVWQTTDITAHAEINAIRQACRKLATIDLSACRIYSTTEPCPMCFAASHWARLSHIYYGAAIADANAAGFSELSISNQQMKQLGGSRIGVTGGLLAEEARALFTVWKNHPGSRGY